MKPLAALMVSLTALSLVSCQNTGSFQNPLAGLFNRSQTETATNGGYSSGSWNQGSSTNTYGYAQSGYGNSQPGQQAAQNWQQAVGNPSNPASYVQNGGSNYGTSYDRPEVEPFTPSGSGYGGYDEAYTPPQRPVTRTGSSSSTTSSSTKVAKVTSGSGSSGTSYTSYRPTSSSSSPSRTSSSTRHSVVKGDTLYSISRRYGMSVAELQSLNGLQGSGIQIGQTLAVR
jgi:LysM repeat protein